MPHMKVLPIFEIIDVMLSVLNCSLENSFASSIYLFYYQDGGKEGIVGNKTTTEQGKREKKKLFRLVSDHPC